MQTIRIVDGKGERREVLGGITVHSSGGVPPAWAELLNHIPREGQVLDWGSWQGLAALWLEVRRQGQIVFAHSSAGRIAQAGKNAAASGLALKTIAMFPLTGQWDTVILTAPEQNDALELLAGQAASCLAPGGQVLVVDKQSRAEILEGPFQSVSQLSSGEGWTIIRCRQARIQNAGLPWRRIQASVRDIQVDLDSLPGNFSPLGLDSGTRAMLAEARIPAGGRVLDLACGYGVVGIIAAKLGAGEVVYIDDDLTALTACRHNLEMLGLEGQLVHSHEPNTAQGKFDCILTNPPYHSDYGVAKSFLEFAAGSLKDGGWLYVVVKKPDWYVNKIRVLFGGCQVVERDGYAVISTQLRRHKPKPAKAKTTRKHARRQEAAQGRGRKNG